MDGTSDQGDPLTEVIVSMITEEAPDISGESVSTIKKTLDSLFSGKLTFQEAVGFIQPLANAQKALEKLQKILTCSEIPLPPPPPIDPSFLQQKKTHPWSQIEDIRLLRSIQKFGLDNWSDVAVFVGNGRTRAQCAQRWSRGLDPHISKNRWTQEQDMELLKLVVIHGSKAWTTISQNLKNRCDVQCRYRFRQLCKLNNFEEQMQEAKRLVEESGGKPHEEDPSISKPRKPRKPRTISNRQLPQQPQVMMLLPQQVPLGFACSAVTNYPFQATGIPMVLSPIVAAPPNQSLAIIDSLHAGAAQNPANLSPPADQPIHNNICLNVQPVQIPAPIVPPPPPPPISITQISPQNSSLFQTFIPSQGSSASITSNPSFSSIGGQPSFGFLTFRPDGKEIIPWDEGTRISQSTSLTDWSIHSTGNQ